MAFLQKYPLWSIALGEARVERSDVLGNLEVKSLDWGCLVGSKVCYAYFDFLTSLCGYLRKDIGGSVWEGKEN